MNKPIDPWELLREARETLHDFAENYDCDVVWHKYDTTCRACDAAKQRDRIDAALAASKADGIVKCEFCKGRGNVPYKKPWSPRDVLGK